MKLASHAAAIFDFEKGGSLGRLGFEVNMAADTRSPDTPRPQENWYLRLRFQEWHRSMVTRKDTIIIEHVQFVVEFYLWLSYNYFVQIISWFESGGGGSRVHRITFT